MQRLYFVTIDAIHVCVRFEDVNGSRCKFLAMSWISIVRNEEDTKIHRLAEASNCTLFFTAKILRRLEGPPMSHTGKIWCLHHLCN